MNWAASALMLLTLAPPAVAQVPGKTEPSVIVAPIGEVHLRPGETRKLEVDFRVSQGFHINSAKPNSPLLIPTKLTLGAPKPLEITAVQYPPGEDQSFPFAPNEKLSVYTGDFALTAVLKAPKSAQQSSLHVSGELYYQACDKQACYPPKKTPVEFTVSVK